MVFFQAGAVRLLLGHGATSALIYIKVDMHATIASLRADGVAIVTEPYVIFRHPDGRSDRPATRSGASSSETRGQPARSDQPQEVRES